MSHRSPRRASIAGRITMVALGVVLLTSWSHAQFKTVFVTSTQTHQGNFGGVAAADNICQTLADAVPLDATNGIYRAWLSTTATSPATDGAWTKAMIEYRLVNGTKVADDYMDLTDGSLDAPINRDELGNAVAPTLALTGTIDNGFVATTTCSDWTSLAGFGTAGDTTSTTPAWTTFGTLFTCSAAFRLYCFQMGPVPVQFRSYTVE